MRFLLSSVFLFLSTTIFSQYYSQCKQDQYVNETFFKNLKNGVFIDIGAYDGISISNSYFFEKELGWRGICIEPSPHIFPKLSFNRKCICINGCISDSNTDKYFLSITGPIEMYSGLLDKYDARHIEYVHNLVKKHGGSINIINVKCFLLNDLLEKYSINHVNFLSIDTEGGELDIIKSIDFSKVQVDVITVENNYFDPEYIPVLESLGFLYHGRLSVDQIFVNKNFYYKG